MPDIGRRRGATFAALITVIALASLAAALTGCAVGQGSGWRLTATQ